MSLVTREVRDDGVMVATLNRPDRHNALSKPLLLELRDAFAEAGQDDRVRCIVLTGAGDRAFSAGADISEQTGFSPEDAYRHMRWGQDLFDGIEQLSKPVIAAINGFALGGGLELALACDIRTASATATLGFPEVNLASLPGWGGTQRLPRAIGLSNAMLMAMTGNRMPAAEALRLGLVSAVFDAGEHLDATLRIAAQVASHEPGSLQAIKQVMRLGLHATALDAGLEAEARAVARLWGTEAQKKAQQQFFARRPKA
jgi:enoyl-CoA hydratase/carnithine racemase